jgi:hypothetical protein
VTPPSVTSFIADGSKRRRTTYGYDPAGRKTSVRVDVLGSVSTGSPVLETGQPQTFEYLLGTDAELRDFYRVSIRRSLLPAGEQTP